MPSTVGMNEVESALHDIARIRRQLEASSRFQGIAPPLVALTGLFALALAAWQAARAQSDLIPWLLLAAVSALMVGVEAVVRARKLHRSMADRLIDTTLRRFMPTATAGAVIGAVILARAHEFARFLPGIWQLLVGVGLFAVLGNLPRAVALAAVFYFCCGALTLALAADPAIPLPWLMGLPFGLGQGLTAAALHFGLKETHHG